MQTLAARGHDRDPECLPCHVVGLTSSKGFQSPKLTPDLVGVGCESCHGPGTAHSASPKLVRIPKVAGSTCGSCHTVNTSPNFSFEKFWKKIKH
ncbi:MAG: multiheme c-type cytochrome [Armatimonadota bacterium]